MLISLLQTATDARESLFDPRHETALRLFHGFSEGFPSLAVDVYAKTLVIHDYAEAGDAETAALVSDYFRGRLPWLQAVVLKQRTGQTPETRNGILLAGTQPDRKIRENGVWYAVDLCLNRDAGFYLDTRNLRAWEMEHLRGKTVLNTFAYTGSLGIAALAGGATRVVQLDLNRKFLNVAKTSCTLNGFPIDRKDFLSGDFWPLTSRLNRDGTRFDCVLLDPPFFASTSKGMIDAENNYARLINKVRPLINDGGLLVAVNNALYVSGAAFIATLESLCADGYLAIETLIPVPPDCTGFAARPGKSPVPDPAPFNHATKIAVLRVRRKQDDQAL